MPFTPFGGTLVANGGISITGSFPGGNMLTLTNTAGAPTDASLVVIGQNVGDRGIGVRTPADTFSRALFSTDGSQKQSSGSAPADVVQSRPAAGIFAVSTGSLSVTTAGQGLRVNEGANGKQGTATLAAGTVVVANTSVTANSRIVCGLVSLGTVTVPSALGVSARVVGTSFTILASQATDTSVVWYEIFEPG